MGRRTKKRQVRELNHSALQNNKPSDSIILGTANIFITRENGTELKVRALCDNGSQVNLITHSILQQLGQKPRGMQTTFYGIGGSNLGTSLGEVMIKIRLKYGGYIENKFYVVKNITSYFPNSTNKWTEIDHKLADNQYNKPGKINALLGVGIWIQIIESEILRSKDLRSIAHKTIRLCNFRKHS